MKTHLKLISLVFALMVTAVLVAQKPTGEEPKPSEDLGVSHFPILDYQKKTSDKKGRKYNIRHAPKVSDTNEIYSIIEWEAELPALPIAKSAAVVVGQVTKAEAQLSEDETNIFSEFTIQITDVLKNDDLKVGNSLVVERSGGRVRLPSGKVVVARVDKQDLPRIGKRYAFFLLNQGNDFIILTAYELMDGKVFPLDKLPSSHPIGAYAGTSEACFFTDLKALVNPSTSQLR